MLLYILIAFLLPVGISILLYFTIIKKKICDGDLRKCPKSGVNICVKSGTSDADFTAMCTKLDPIMVKSSMNQCLAYLDGCNDDCGDKQCLTALQNAVKPGGVWYPDDGMCNYTVDGNDTVCKTAKDCQNRWCGH